MVFSKKFLKSKSAILGEADAANIKKKYWGGGSQSQVWISCCKFVAHKFHSFVERSKWVDKAVAEGT